MLYRRGFALLEIMITTVILGLLMSMVFFIYRVSASTFAQGEARSDILTQMQTTILKLQRELRGSTFASLSSENSGQEISFLSGRSDSGPPHFDPATGETNWRCYKIYWLDPGSETLRYRSLELAPGSPEIQIPGPIEKYDQAKPLSSYLNDGRVLLRGAQTFEVLNPGPGLPLKIQLIAGQERYGREGKEKLKLQATVLMRN